METQRIWKRYSQVVCIVLTLFLIIGFFDSDVFATTHYSLLNQPSTTIAAPPVILQSGSAGNSTIYANNTSAKVNVTAPERQYVTQQSNIDGVADVGTHSNFTAQQYGPDNISDTLTEAGVPVISEQFVQNNASDIDGNGDIGTASNFTTEQSTDNTYDTLTEANTNAVPYAPITFNNTGSSATPNPFQEKITWNPSSYTSYEASDLGNIRFYSDDALTTPLYAWLESCTPSLSNTATNATAWIKLTSPIAANGGTLTIYMAFLSTSTGFDGNYWGDAPNLSPTYGQYDNGANVFSFYDNFAGNTISSAWNTAGAAGTYSVNNGLTVYSGAFPTYTFTLNDQYTGPLIIDAYQVGTTGGWIGASFSNLQTTDASYSLASGAILWLYPPQGPWSSFTGLFIASGGTTVTPNPPGTTLQVVTLAVNSTVATEYQNYASPVTASGTISLTNYPGLVQLAYSTSSDTQTTYWFRLRAYPPNNVMPSASFGFLQNYRLDLERQWTTASYNANASKLLCIRTGTFSDSEAIEVDVWNGAWTVLNNSLAANSWNNMSVTTYLTSASFAIRFIDTTIAGDPTQSTWQIDSVLLHTSNSTDNYQLDIEEQWTNANSIATNEELDIYMGAFSTPASVLSVQWYNTTSSSWLTIISSLNASTWNNVTVVNYLTSSTFTIRFVNTTSGGTQSWWQIDCSLLHLWTNSTYDDESARAWLSGWSYRKSHVINYASGAGTLYQKQITVHYGAGADSVQDVYCTVGGVAHCKTDFGDIRFTDDDGSTLLDYWMESKTDSDNAIFWVEVADDLSSVSSTIYLYYGKSDATTTSSGVDTFNFFDDFSGDLSKWSRDKTSGVYPQIENGYMRDGGGTTSPSYGHTSLGSSPTYSAFLNNSVLYRARMSSDGIGEVAFRGNFVANTGYKGRHDARINQGQGFLKPPYSDWNFVTGAEQDYNNPSTDVWYIFEITAVGDTFRLYRDGVLKRTATDTQYSNAGEIALQNHYGSYTDYDWVAVRKSVDPEPSDGAWGSETNTSYHNVLEIVNQVANGWKINLKVYNSSNVERLTSTAISLNDGTTSDQIIVSGGVITQSEGALYDLLGNATVYIKISNLQSSTAGTSYLYAYLKILVPNTTNYLLYIITFEIT